MRTNIAVRIIYGFLLVVCCNFYTMAATYHSLKSGRFADSTVWDVKLVPPIALMAGDTIYITAGHDVQLDTNLHLDSAAGVCIYGNLKQAAGLYIAMYRKSYLTIHGALTTDSIAFTGSCLLEARTQFYCPNVSVSLADSTAETYLTGSVQVQNLYLKLGKMYIGDYSYIYADTIIGAGTGSYILTPGYDAFLYRRAKIQPQLYPLGTRAYYLPIWVHNKTSAEEHSAIPMNLVANVLRHGLDISGVEPLVDATWSFGYGSHYGITVDIEVEWPADAERNGFNRQKSFVSLYGWEKNLPAYAAAPSGNNRYRLSRTNITISKYGRPPLAVFGENAFASAKNLIIRNNIKIYPNPPTQLLYADVQQPARALIYNAAGQVVSNTQVDAANKSINIATLPAGIYIIKLAGDELNAIGRFVKQ